MLRASRLVVDYGASRVVDQVDLSVPRGTCVGLVGESGSGKTTLSRCLAGLLQPQGGVITLNGEVLAPLAQARSLEARLAIQYVFQNPFSALNPRKNIDAIIRQPLRAIGGPSDRKLLTSRVAGALDRVALSVSVLSRRPSELSGGERQRVAIARALVCDPAYLVCDEVTSALDVSVQAVIVALLRELVEEAGLGVLFVTHDLALVRAIANEVIVLQGGHLVESGSVDQLFASPEAHYTRQLLRDLPRRPSMTTAAGCRQSDSTIPMQEH